MRQSPTKNMDTIVNERELDFADIINEGLKIFLFKFKDILLITLISFIPTNLFIIFIASETNTLSVEKNGISAIVLRLLLIFIEAIVYIIVSMSVAIIVEQVIDRKDVSAIGALKDAFSKWDSALTTCALSAIIVFGLTLALVIPGIIYTTYYTFVISVVALRNKFGKEALDYSKELVKGQWWRVFGILFGLGITIDIFAGIIVFPLSKISDNPYYAIIPSTVGYLLSILFSVMNVVLFLNNDFVYHHRLAKRAEAAKLRKIKKAPTFEQFIQKLEDKQQPSDSQSKKRKSVRQTTRKKAATKIGSKSKNQKAGI